MKKYHFIAAILFYLLVVFSALATLPQAPTLQRRVNDLTHTLTQQQISSLERQIIQFENKHPDGRQLAVLLIVNLPQSTTIDEFSNQVFNKWQLGQIGKDNGVLILIALNDRALRIEVGYGLEDQLTDLQAKRIIDLFLVPNFKDQNYYQGISQSINAIDSVISDPVNNVLVDKENQNKIYYFLILFAGMNSLIITLLLLIFYVLRPTNTIIECCKRFLLLLFTFCLLMFACIVFYYRQPFEELIKNWAFFTLFSFLFSIMALFAFSMLQLLFVLPLLNSLVTIFIPKRINSRGELQKTKVKFGSKTAITSTIIFIIIFALLPRTIQFLVALTYFFAICIYAAINGKTGSGDDSSGRGDGGTSGFSGGGGRSGGGGASGSW